MQHFVTRMLQKIHTMGNPFHTSLFFPIKKAVKRINKAVLPNGRAFASISSKWR